MYAIRSYYELGLGYTRINEAVTYLSSSYYYPNTYLNEFEYSGTSINGFNMIIENEYKITSRFLIGCKLFVTGGIEEGGIVSGGMIKLGIVLVITSYSIHYTKLYESNFLY